MKQEEIEKLHASRKSKILATPCQNLLAGSVDGGENILEKVEEPPSRQGAPKGRFYAAKSFAIASTFNEAQFVAAAFTQEGFPKMMAPSGQPMPEIAVVGRSNVGKSSLINHLLRKKLAKTSSVPGKTQSINFFSVDNQIALVDLPGYGYAKVPKQIRKQWGDLIDDYLENRPALRLILFLLDSRRELTEEDRALIDWAAFHQKPILVIFTKADKLSRAQRQKNVETESLYYSIKDPHARMELIAKINGLLWD